MIRKSLSEIVEADILGLCQSGVEESITLEFKQALPGNTRDDKKEFVADVCALANAKGGDIVFGISEDDAKRAGSVRALSGIADNEINRLSSVLDDCVEPKLHGIVFHSVQLTTGGYVLVVRVPRSFSGIHRNRLDAQFHIRESRSKRQLDVPGIINRVSEYLEREDRVNEFFARRYAAIAANSYPLKLKEGPKVVMHVLPARDFLSGEEVDLTPLSRPGSFDVMPANGSSYATHTFDGVLHHHEVDRSERTVRAATLLFRSGVVEAIAAILPLGGETSASRCSFEAIESYVARFASVAIPKLLASSVVGLPVVIRVALTNMAGESVKTIDRDLSLRLDPVPHVDIHAPVLAYPEVLIEEQPGNWGVRLEPTFDRIWQTWGYARAFSFEHRVDGIYRGGHKVAEPNQR